MRGKFPSTLPAPATERPSRLAAKARVRWTTRPTSEVRGRRCRLAQCERGSARAGVRRWMLRSSTGTDFDARDCEMATPGGSELRVRPLLGTTGNLEGCSSSAGSDSAWSTSRRERCNLCSIPKRKAVSDDLNPALVSPPRLNIQIPKQDVLLDCGSSFAADAGCCLLKRPVIGLPRERSTPERGHAATWSPKASKPRWQRQAPGARGSGIYAAGEAAPWKRGDGRQSSGEVGRAVRTRAAYEPTSMPGSSSCCGGGRHVREVPPCGQIKTRSGQGMAGQAK